MYGVGKAVQTEVDMDDDNSACAVMIDNNVLSITVESDSSTLSNNVPKQYSISSNITASSSNQMYKVVPLQNFSINELSTKNTALSIEQNAFSENALTYYNLDNVPGKNVIPIDISEVDTKPDYKDLSECFITKRSLCSDSITEKHAANNESTQIHTTNKQFGNLCSEMSQTTERNIYTCGACQKSFEIICELHQHLLRHVSSGSYIFNIDTRTAYPKFDGICKAIQASDLHVVERDEDIVFEQVNEVGRDLYVENTDAEVISEQVKINQPGTDSLVEDSNGNMVSEQVSLNEPRAVLDHDELKTMDGSTKKRSNIQRHSQRLKRNKNIARYSEDTEDIYIMPKNKTMKDSKFTESSETSDPDEKKFKTLTSDSDVNSDVKPRLNRSIEHNIQDIEGETPDIMDTSKDPLSDWELENCDNDDSDSDSDQSLQSSKSESESKHGGRKTKSVVKERKYKCEECGIFYRFQTGLDKHMSTCHLPEPFKLDGEGTAKVPFNCRWCSKVFATRTKVLEHSRICQKNKNLKCFICERIFPNLAKRLKHLETHQNKSDLTCKLCGKQCSSMTYMMKHMRGHNTPRNVICDKCGMSFQFKNRLTQHLIYCSDERPFKCAHTGCGQTFKTIYSLKGHYTIHTQEKAYICHICGFSGRKKDYLKKHMRIHTGERPYKCTICDKSFKNSPGLNRHEKIHTNRNMCICNYCGKSFTNNWNLKIHVRQHTGDTPYKCKECGMGFKQNVLVKLHMKSHHSNV